MQLTVCNSFATLSGMKRRIAKRRKPETVKVGNIVVRIYRRQTTVKGREYQTYQVEDYTTGRRVLRSISDHGEAIQEAERIANQLSTGEVTAAQMSNSEAADYGSSVETLRPTGIGIVSAAAIVAKAVEILGGDRIIEAARFFARHRADKITHKTVAEVVTELIEAKEGRGKSDRYIGDLSARLTRFAESNAGDIGNVTTADVQRWLDGLKVAPQTAKNFRTVLHTLFSFAESRGYIFKGGNPVADTEHISTNGGAAIEIYSPAEMLALLNHAPTAFVPVLALGAFAGLRSAEIQRLQWSDVDVAGGFIHMSADNAKTRSRRLVPIVPNLAQWLAPYSGNVGSVWKGSDRILRGARAQTVKASGIAWKDNAARHSFISYRLADVQDVNKVALEAGNSATVIFKHYRELVKPEAAKAWFGVTPETEARNA